MKRISGPDVAALPEDLRGTPIGITDSRVGSWTAESAEVVSRKPAANCRPRLDVNGHWKATVLTSSAL